MDGPGMVLIRMNGERIKELSVSDPSRKLDTITLTVSGIYNASGDGFHMAPDRRNDSSAIAVTLPEGVYAGKSVSFGF